MLPHGQLALAECWLAILLSASMRGATLVDTDVSASLSFQVVLRRADHLKAVSFRNAIPDVAAFPFCNGVDTKDLGCLAPIVHWVPGTYRSFFMRGWLSGAVCISRELSWLSDTVCIQRKRSERSCPNDLVSLDSKFGPLNTVKPRSGPGPHV